jgi:hypothetical protein
MEISSPKSVSILLIISPVILALLYLISPSIVLLYAAILSLLVEPLGIYGLARSKQRKTAAKTSTNNLLGYVSLTAIALLLFYAWFIAHLVGANF